MSTSSLNRRSTSGSLSNANAENLRCMLRNSDLERSKLLNENASLRAMKLDPALQDKQLNQFKGDRAKSCSTSEFIFPRGTTNAARRIEELSAKVDELEAEKAYFKVMCERLKKRVENLEEEKQALEQLYMPQDETEAAALINRLRKELEECRDVIAQQERRKQSMRTRVEDRSPSEVRVENLEDEVKDLKQIVRELSVSTSRRAAKPSVSPASANTAGSAMNNNHGGMEVLQRIILQQGQYIKALQDEVTVFCCSPEASLPALERNPSDSKEKGIVSYARQEKTSKSPSGAEIAELHASTKSSKMDVSSGRDDPEPEPLPPAKRKSDGETTNESKLFDISYCSMAFNLTADDNNNNFNDDAGENNKNEGKQVHFDDMLVDELQMRLTDASDAPESCPNTPPPRQAILLNARFSDVTSERPSTNDSNKENTLGESEK